MDYYQAIDKSRVPKHIAIIMDGNGRWAKERGEDRVYGHHEGVLSVRDIVNSSAEIGVQYLTLYAFSTENWNRPKAEVDALMELLVNTIRKEAEELKKNGVRLHVIGDFASLPAICQKEMQEAMDMTAHNTRLNLVLALSYSARWEMANAAKQIALADVNAVMETGKTNLIIGASGSGKTVMMKIMVGLMQVDEGQVLYEGQDITSMEEKDLKDPMSKENRAPILPWGMMSGAREESGFLNIIAVPIGENGHLDIDIDEDTQSGLNCWEHEGVYYWMDPNNPQDDKVWFFKGPEGEKIYTDRPASAPSI
ncbi:putative di-trans,poly-cis-decaprenylcistransferase [Ostertagia ostertagi]